MLSPEQVASAFLAACRAELAALKPGNVHAHAGGHTMQVADFELSAVAAAPPIANAARGVGEKILAAANATWDAVGCNTNLGILLLCAPLAKAAERISASRRGDGLGEAGGTMPPVLQPPSPRLRRGGRTQLPSLFGREDDALRHALHEVIATLTVADADFAFRAIHLMNPAGLGRPAEGDVAAPAQITLRQAMALAAERDRIARAYVTDYEDIFDVALPRLRLAESAAETPDLAVTTLHMALLASFPDSHIARKHGADVAEAIRREAATLLPACQPVATQTRLAPLLAFDRHLKARAINPGTTADLVVTTLFTSLIQAEIAASTGL